MGKFKMFVVGSSQLSFPGDKAAAFTKNCDKLKALADELDVSMYVYPRTVITPEDAKAAVCCAEDQKTDFLLVQCTSFSSGFLAPIFGRIKNAYLGLWAIPEYQNEGVVPFNSFCSINLYAGIIGHYLKDYKIPLKWFFGDAGDRMFKERMNVSLRALKAIKKLRSSKVALIGGVAPGFNDLYDDERNIVRRLDGIEINRLHEFSEIRDLAVSYSEKEIASYLEQIKSDAKGIHQKAAPLLETSARFAKAYDDFIAQYGYNALAISCWPKFQSEFQYSVCSVVAGLNDKCIAAACEGDLLSAISMLLLQYIADAPTTLMDMSAFDPSDETLLMWHCGPASKQYCSKDGYTLSVNYHGMAHEEGCKEPNCCGVTRDMVFAPGKATIARFTGECDKMLLASGSFIDYQKDSFFGSRGWLGSLELNNQGISALDMINTVLVQRFQHHFPIVRGDYNREVLEVMAWLDLKPIQAVPYRDYMQPPNS